MTSAKVGVVVADGRHTVPCNWVDYDKDGYPDLWVGTGIYGLGTPVGTHFLYHNNGNGSFSRVSPGSMALQTAGVLAAWADYDNDGFPDLFMANYPGVNSLHHNLDGQSFTNVAESAGLATAMQSWCGAWGDYDNDGFQISSSSTGKARTRCFTTTAMALYQCRCRQPDSRRLR
jgi:hypothetical protein